MVKGNRPGDKGHVGTEPTTPGHCQAEGGANTACSYWAGLSLTDLGQVLVAQPVRWSIGASTMHPGAAPPPDRWGRGKSTS